MASEVVTGVLPWGTTYTINSIVCWRQGAGKKPLTERLIFASLWRPKEGPSSRCTLFEWVQPTNAESPTAYLCGRVLYSSSCCVRPHTSMAKNVCRSRAHCSVAATATHQVVNSIPSYAERSIEPLRRPVMQFWEIFD